MRLFRLTVTQPGEPEPATFFLNGDAHVIGRDPSVDLPIATASISARHGHFRPDPRGYTYTDLNSTNGSVLVRSGTPEVLGGGEPVPLASGDTILLGDREAPVVVYVEDPIEMTERTSGGAHATHADVRTPGPEPSVEVALTQLAAHALAALTPDELAHAALAFLAALAPLASERGVQLWGPHLASCVGTPPPSAIAAMATSTATEAILLDDSDGALLPKTVSVVASGVRAALVGPLVASGQSWGVLYAASPLGVTALPHTIVRACAVAGPLLALASAQLSGKRDDAARRAALERQNAELAGTDTSAADDSNGPMGPSVPNGPIGRAPNFLAAIAIAREVAPSGVPVLVVGETGTGKEVLARSLHRWSRRASHPFVAFNCAAVPAGLLESELFGHAKGAFTGAHGTRRGIFEEANHGTLFLDEIGEMPAAMQAKLLRVLQEGEVRPVGATKSIPVDVRVVSATHRDLTAMVAVGGFRADLFYRINAVTVRVPPLRDRGDDVVLLAHALLGRAQQSARKRVAGFGTDALWALSTYRFPGNVRELGNEILRAVALTPEGTLIRADAFSETLRDGAQLSPSIAGGGAPQLKDYVARAERLAIADALARTHNNVQEAAMLLGVSRPGLYRAIERLGLR